MTKIKVKLELTLNDDFKPVIKFRHYNKADGVNNRILDMFINEAKKGIDLVRTDGRIILNSEYAADCWDEYEIQTNK